MANEQVIEIYGNSASALSTFTTELLRDAVKDGSLEMKVAAIVPNVKLSVLSYSGDMLKIKIAYDSGNANSVGQAVFEAIGGAVIGGAGVAAGRMLGVVGPWWGVGGAVVGGAVGSYAGGEVGKSIWEQALTSPQREATLDLLGLGQVGFRVTQQGMPSAPISANAPGVLVLPNSGNTNLETIIKGVDGSLSSTTGTVYTRDPNTAFSSSNYTVQSGDSLWKIAQDNGVKLQDLIDANPQITHPNLIHAGQIINLSPSAFVPTANTFTSTVTDPLGIGSTGAADPTTSINADNSTLLSTGAYTVNGIGNVNTTSGNTAYANNQIAGLRPGSYSLVDQILDSQFARNVCLDPNLSFADSILGAALNTVGSGVLNTVPTDPLVLDLNGDGVKLTSFADAPVLFDINHDGGSKELTGWVSAQDGIVVYDLNGNGKIDDISETMSEYFNGTVGAGGNEGTKPYANGFAALKSLDSNSDNQFDSGDAAWNNVKVWVDANHDGVTDAGELKTFSSLGITGINLAPTTQSGLVSGGNEILASGTFTLNGTTQQAQAARFIANPTGNTTTVSATGSTVAAADGQSTYISSVATGETIDVALKGVKNAYGNTGNDTLTGDANANWLAGNQGSDTFNAGAGDDVLLIDAADLQANIHGGAGNDIAMVVGDAGMTLNMAQAEIEAAVGGRGNDIFIGGGRSSVFVLGVANDVLWRETA